jgi:ATP-dependent RNA helicase SUPV3L1/SUV3
VAKWNGKEEVPLSVSQIKQIAGRAGRFGLHEDAEAGGVATTLREDGMAALRKAIAVPMTSISCARLGEESMLTRTHIVEALPPGAPLSAVLSVVRHVCAPRAPYRMVDLGGVRAVVAMIDELAAGLDLQERLHLSHAPIQMRDPRVADGMLQFLRAYRAALSVRVRRALGPSGLLQHLATVGALRREPGARRVTMMTLAPLESLHKLLSCYIWLAYRNPVVWSDIEDAAALKAETEGAMTWCLARLAVQAKEGGWKSETMLERSFRKKMDRQTRRDEPDFHTHAAPKRRSF